MDEGSDCKGKIINDEVIPEEQKTSQMEENSGEKSNSETTTSMQNGNKGFTIVAEENNGKIIVYERNGEVVEIEDTSEFLQACSSNDVVKGDNGCQETGDEINKECNEKGEAEKEKEEGKETEKENEKEEGKKIEKEKENENEKVEGKKTEKENENEKETKKEENNEKHNEAEKIKEGEGEEENLAKKNGKEKTNSCNDENEKNKNGKEIASAVADAEIVSEKNLENISEENQSKNYRSVILEDWEVDVPHSVESHETKNFTESARQVSPTEEPQNKTDVAGNTQETINCIGETVEEATKETDKSEIPNESEKNDGNSVNDIQKENSSAVLEGDIQTLVGDMKVDYLKYLKTVSKNDIVKILEESAERVVKPIVIGKDLFFSIELTKRLNQKLIQNKSTHSGDAEKRNNSTEIENVNNNNTVDDRQKIVDILEADEIKDWKSIPSKSDLNLKENGNDMEISNAIKNMEEGNSAAKTLPKSQKRSSLKKFRTMDKELERTIALQQLREEFPSTRKRSRKAKKVNRIPFLASTVLEKAMTSPEVTTALKPDLPKRRPCYLPEVRSKSISSKSSPQDESQDSNEKSKNLKMAVAKSSIDAAPGSNSKAGNDSVGLDLGLDSAGNAVMSNPVVKTYPVKRKSTEAEINKKSTRDTISAAAKQSPEDGEGKTDEIVPKKPKTAVAATKREKQMKKKVKAREKRSGRGGTGRKGKNWELEKLLGDEGAVRMLYETQQRESDSGKARAPTGRKNDLVLKTKLVKNAVMRLSGVGSEGVCLRGKRFSTVNNESEPLFASTPKVFLNTAKKKQRADASRILYRHSSSESFDSSEGYRRTSFDADGFNSGTSKECSTANEVKLDESNAGVGPESEAEKSKTATRKMAEASKSGNRSSRKRKVERSGVGNPVADVSNDSKLDLSNVPVRKSSRPRKVSKKYSVWSSTSMDSLSAESLGLKKLKKASPELGKKLNCRELTVLQYESLVQVVLSPVSTLLKNSMNLGVLEELTKVFRFLSEENSCKAVLLSSAGTTFCQGIDVNEVISCGETERKNVVSQLAKAIGEFSVCLADFKKPLIVGVQGAAVGLGVTLLPYCDLVVASDNASFYTPYVKLGQAPEGASSYTFPRISRYLVSELLIQSHKMTATDAFKNGLVSRIIPEERFEEDLFVLARNMASQPSQGIQSIKFLVDKINRKELIESLRAEGEFLEKHWTTPECINNMIKFFNSGELQLKQTDQT